MQRREKNKNATTAADRWQEGVVDPYANDLRCSCHLHNAEIADDRAFVSLVIWVFAFLHSITRWRYDDGFCTASSTRSKDGEGPGGWSSDAPPSLPKKLMTSIRWTERRHNGHTRRTVEWNMVTVWHVGIGSISRTAKLFDLLIRHRHPMINSDDWLNEENIADIANNMLSATLILHGMETFSIGFK